MKALFASLLIAVTTQSFADPTTTPNAKASFQSSVYVSAASHIRVAVDKENSRSVKIRLVDEKGHTVATELVSKKQSHYRGRFVVNDLPDGHYKMVITDGAAVETRTIDVVTNQPAASVNRVISIL